MPAQHCNATCPGSESTFTLETRADYDPATISRAVGIEPSRKIRKGEVQSNGKPSISTRWTVSTSERHAGSFDRLLEEMLSLLEPRLRAISSLTTDELDGVLSLIGHVAGQAPTVRLRVEQLRLIRELGLAIDVDLLT
jgi:hypothetical protein